MTIASFFVVFLVTFLVIGGVVLAMVFGKPPVYKPEIDDVQATLSRMLDGQLSEEEWQFFVEMPIRLDPSLDDIRLKCFKIQSEHRLRSRNGCARLSEHGLLQLQYVLKSLEEQGSKSF